MRLSSGYLELRVLGAKHASIYIKYTRISTWSTRDLWILGKVRLPNQLARLLRVDLSVIFYAVNQYIATLTRSLNHAIALSTRENPFLPKSQYVRAILLTKGIPFYGFHYGYAPFLKVLIANPLLVKRAVTLLQSGHVMKTKFRVFESHINFMLQFMCDFGE